LAEDTRIWEKLITGDTRIQEELLARYTGQNSAQRYKNTLIPLEDLGRQTTIVVAGDIGRTVSTVTIRLLAKDTWILGIIVEGIQENRRK
jgi:hypothetical protein